jgi:predicted membrane protein
MWPVLIVAIGLDLIFGRRSGIWPAILVILVVAVFAGAYWMFDVTESVWSGEKVSKTVVQELGLAEDANVHIKMNIGSMKIDALPTSSDYLITGNVEISEFENLTDDFRISDNMIFYTLSSEGQQYHPGWFFNRDVDQNKNWEILLSPNVMMDLEVDTGVGKTEIDLSELNLSDLDISSGVGELTVTMPVEGNFRANLKAGVGKLAVNLPADLAVKIHVDGGLGNVSVIGDFSQGDGVYFTQNYSSSSDRLTIYVDGGVGNIQIVQLEN